MNILVTGSNGQLGRSIQKIASFYPSFDFLFTDIAEVDITDSQGIEKLIVENQIKAIINCAAYTAVDKAETDRESAARINADGPFILAQIAKRFNVKLIHISTDYVFSGKSYLPLKESDPTNPIGVYGQTKLEGELAVIKSGCDSLIIRTSWLYSEFGNNFVKTMLHLGGVKSELNVIYDQIGTPTYAEDLARTILFLLQKDFSGNTIYHYSNEGAISWYDFADAIFDLSGISIKLNAIESFEYPTAAQRPFYSVLNKRKIKEQGVIVPYWRDSLINCLKNL
jgi:dTDP-4-dehydrorhamnose reductase